MILDHGNDRSLVDSEVVEIDPSFERVDAAVLELLGGAQRRVEGVEEAVLAVCLAFAHGPYRGDRQLRSEEHTSELQSQSNLVCRLLLEKKNSNPSSRD